MLLSESVMLQCYFIRDRVMHWGLEPLQNSGYDFLYQYYQIVQVLKLKHQNS